MVYGGGGRRPADIRAYDTIYDPEASALAIFVWVVTKDEGGGPRPKTGALVIEEYCSASSTESGREKFCGDILGPWACCGDKWPLMTTCTAGRPFCSILGKSKREGA